MTGTETTGAAQATGTTQADLAGDHRSRVERPVRLQRPGEFELKPGGAYRSRATEEMRQGAARTGYPAPPDVIVDGEVLESDPPRKLVQTWRMNMDLTCQAEGR